MASLEPSSLYYQAIDADGRRVFGQLDAHNREEALRRLNQAGLSPVAIEDHPVRQSIWSREIALFGGRRLRVGTCLEFCKGLAIILRSGLSFRHRSRQLQR